MAESGPELSVAVPFLRPTDCCCSVQTRVVVCLLGYGPLPPQALPQQPLPVHLEYSVVSAIWISPLLCSLQPQWRTEGNECRIDNQLSAAVPSPQVPSAVLLSVS